MFKSRLVSLAAALLALGTVSLAQAQSAPGSSLQCTIRAHATADGLTLEALVFGRPGSAGAYQFMLEKSGTGGMSNVNQGGDFSLPASGVQSVAATDINLDRGDSYHAMMSLDAGKTSCATDDSDGLYRSLDGRKS
jgi:hypothetical protein